MTDFIKILGDEVGCNEGISSSQMAMANVKLKQSSLASVPEEFASLLQKYNGLSNEGALIFGAEINSTMFTDLVKFNKDFFNGNPSKWIILGYDECFYLIFDSVKKTYNVVDKDTFEPTISSKGLERPVKFLLHING